MREAVVSIRDGDGSALGLADVVAVFRAAGLGDVEVLSCEGARSVVRVTVDEPVEEVGLDASPAVPWWERVADGDGAAYVLELDVSAAGETVGACADGLVACETLAVSPGDVTLEVAGPQGAIADTVADYEDAGATVRLRTLRDVGAREQPLDALTDRQREVVREAFEVGYYDVPRSASTADVAAALDLDASTVAEHLQRAERNLIAGVLPP